MKSLRNILILATALIIVVNLPALAQSPEQLYQRGLVKEEGEGAMEEAISLYDQVADNSNADQALRAKALLHIGMCYERMGTQEAVEAYQRLVTDFPTQKNEVAIARERLSSLIPMAETGTEEPEGIKIKQIWKSPYLDDIGKVSSDGQFRSFVNWGVGNVALHNLITDEKTLLTHEADLGDSTHFAANTVISKNGNTIAYSWWNPHNTNDLRLIDVDNPLSRLLYRKKGEELYPRTWLSDKELVVIRFIPEAKTTQMISFNVLDKTEQVLKTFDVPHFPQIDCSPDEKYLAYDFPNETDDGNSDINIMLANGDKDISLISHPANDRVLGWVPGRQEFLFTSDRSGSWDLWAIPLDDGKPSGPVKKIYMDIGEVEPMGFTENGTCYFGFSRRKFYSSITPFNKETGEIKMGSGRSMKSSNYGMTWSPDGQYMAYLNLDDKRNFVIQDLKTGEEHKPSDKTLIPFGHSWSPDGNSILVVGGEENQSQTLGYKGEIFLIDIETGQTDEILQLSDYDYNVPGDDAFPLSGLEWFPDGKSFYYLFFKDRLVKHDLETGKDKILFKSPGFTRGVLDLSPDGTKLLFGLEYPGNKKSRLFTMPAEGGKENELCTTQEARGFEIAFWDPDGTYIYFVELMNNIKTNLWRVPSTGGLPEKVWRSENRVDIFDIHPDGNKVAVSIRERATEVRAIENLSHELAKIYDQNE
jgi:Tol biopolymer transport system component